MRAATLSVAPAAGQVLDDAVSRLEPVSLAQVVQAAELQRRVDRKYLVPVDLLPAILEGGRTALEALEIDGRRRFGYDTLYFDTPTLDFYRHHLQGRRRRAKVRTRTYTDSGDCVLEVKLSGGRGATDKQRLAWAPGEAHVLGEVGRDFVAGHVPGVHAESLRPTSATRYDRTTLLSVRDASRVTVDVLLTASVGGRQAHLDPRLAVLETKTSGAPGPVDLRLRRLGVRPMSLSKYCLAVAALHPWLPAGQWRRVLRAGFGWEPGRTPSRAGY